MNIRHLNSATKYPSILTYHKLGDKGRLLDDLTFPMSPATDPLIFTEKIDGTNSRIVISPTGDYFIGSREEFVYAKGDRLWTPDQGIAEHLKSYAEDASERWAREVIEFFGAPSWIVIYGEHFGGNVGGNAKNYGRKSRGYRVFDIAIWTEEAMNDLCSWPVEKIAAWRDNGGQCFGTMPQIADACNTFGFEQVPFIYPGRMPADIAGTHEWLKNACSTTRVMLDPDALGKSEGIVARNQDRSFIVKIRHEDYERTLRTR